MAHRGLLPAETFPSPFRSILLEFSDTEELKCSTKLGEVKLFWSILEEGSNDTGFSNVNKRLVPVD